MSPGVAPAGQVHPSEYTEDEGDSDLRIAFDFDGVLADDASEQVMQAEGLDRFHAHETANVVTPHSPGPLHVTARNAPFHQRAVASLKSWGVTVNDAFFLGGIDKGAVISVLRPHIFFDDQQTHLTSTARVAPSVHVPFGIVNAQ